jgi:hypothetical protein
VDRIILSPAYELYFLEDKKYIDLILPLFSRYVSEYCFAQSLVGKVGVM